MPPVPPAVPAPAFGRLGDDRFGHEGVLRDRGGVLERRAGDHGRVDDPGLDQVLDLVGVDVESVALEALRTLSTTIEPSTPALYASWRSGSSSARTMICAPVRCH
jgi:hypothetical protein